MNNADSGSSYRYDIPSLDNNGSNYNNWKFRVSTLLKMKGLMGIVKGTENCLPERAIDQKDQAAVTATFDR